MSKSEEFIKREKEYFGKIYVDLTYAIDNVSPFISDKDLNSRKYVTKLPLLKKYIELIEAAESELNKKSSFSKLFDQDKYIDLLNSYKTDNEETLTQLENCSKCVYKNSMESKFDGCLACKPKSRIVYCDNKKINVRTYDNWSLDLTNDRTGELDKYKALATLQDIELDQKYIIIENYRTKEKFILYYYPGISEDSYGEISNPEEFDYIVSIYQGVE
ncbi:DUF1292 domain-containing protein [Clostridium sp. DJ247]|uniref:DUF1292 domain-containing protein n=1 Tax=Clostridium sp. DJ247 TaxID=2726188 RepID=UPI001628B412|nr:DUF1292 domain-containing protein [Clostridium sp. DJ247]MBC2581339.1 DUF1292 domain-containing protein [Clostridium sp. DJ247]